MRQDRETDLVRACLELLQLRGVLAWRNNNAGVRRTDRRAGREFWTFAGVRGAPDILGVLPPRGTLLACEVKLPGGKVRPEQAIFLEEVGRRGGLALVVRDVRELDEALRRAA